MIETIEKAVVSKAKRKYVEHLKAEADRCKLERNRNGTESKFNEYRELFKNGSKVFGSY